MSGEAAARIEAQLREAKGFERTDQNYFGDLLQGTINDAQILEGQLKPHLDRPFRELSPVERGILLLAGHELLRRPEIPYKVIINEAVELAKEYGGTDGYKYVNGVLDKLAAQVREAEIKRQSEPPTTPRP